MPSCSVDDMRYAIAKVYPGPNWKSKVKRMGDSQVIALYYKFLGDGKFDRKPKDISKKKPEPVSTPQQSEQVSYQAEQMFIDECFRS